MATEKSLRKKVATWGDAYKGIAEGSSAHKELINIFNNSGLCSRYKMTTSDAWCAMFVSDAFIATGLISIFPCVECYCPSMISMAQSAGIWVEDDAYVPEVGDVIMYDWDDSGSGDNTGTADHVGIVQSVSGSSFTVIEGNKSDTVGVRSMTVNGRYIRGYITPDYASAASGKSSSTDSGTTTGTTSGTKTIDELANEVIAGKWGNGTERQTALEAAGYDYNAVQERVNELMSSGSSSTNSAKKATTLQAAQSFEKGYTNGKKYKVTAVNGLYLRYGPDKDKFDAITCLTLGTAVYYYGYYDKDSDGYKWLLVIENGTTGWVRSDYVA